MADTDKVEINGKELTFSDVDSLEAMENCVASLDESKLDKIERLHLTFCFINPKIFVELLSKLQKVKDIQLEFCASFDSPEDSFPDIEKKLKSLTVGLDLNRGENNELYDCKPILLNPKIKLPAKDLTIDRFDRGWTEREDWEDSHLIGYVKRFKDDVKYVRLDSGDPGLWKHLAKENGLQKIKFGVIKVQHY